MLFENLSSSEKELSKELGKELEKIYADTPELKFEELLNRYRYTEKKHLKKLDKNVLIQETKRRVSEVILYSALEKNLSFKECENFFNELKKLGYSNLEKKINIHLIYSRHWLETKYKNKALNILTEIIPELDNKLAEKLNDFETLVYMELKRNVDGVFER